MKKFFVSSLIIFCVSIIYCNAQLNLAWSDLTIDVEGSCFPMVAGVVTDVQKNAYTCWAAPDSIGSPETVIFITKYHSNGNLLWTKKYHAQHSINPYGYAPVDVRIAGNVIYVGGYLSDDLFISAIDTTGNFLWQREVGISCNGYNHFGDIETTPDGGIIISGFRWPNQCTIEHSLIQKYDNVGNLQWWDTIPNSSYVSGLYVDGFGNSYVGSTRLNSVNINSRDMLILKYDPNGIRIFEVNFNSDSLGGNADMIEAIEESTDHSIWVTGYGGVWATSPQPWITLRLDQWGNLIHRTSSAGVDRSVGYSMSFDLDGNCYVTGSENPTGSGQFITTIKYDTACQQVWKQYYGPSNCTYAFGVENWTDSLDNIFAAGFWRDSINTRFVILQYDRNTAALIDSHSVVQRILFLPANGGTHISSCDNSIYYAIIFNDVFGYPYINTAKLEKVHSTSIEELKQGDFTLFPNPLHGNELTLISTLQIERVSIYDIHGKLLFARNISGNSIVLGGLNLSGGVYFVEADSGNILKRMKLIVE